MAINQGAGVGSVSMKKDNQESDDGKLGGVWVKLKIPKEEKELEGCLYINGEEKKKRVCHICQKTFSSGKALGGHMRIHVQPPNKKLDHDAANSKKQLDVMKPTCFTCGKDFKSMKSLSGHMRSHPERVWRGIRPPSSVNTSSSSASLSPPNFDDQIRVSVSGEKADSRVLDLTQWLPTRWPVTAKRGRKGTVVASSSEVSSSEDDQFRKAVYYLMMLSKEVIHEKKYAQVLETNEGVTSDVVNEESVVNSFSDDDERDHRKKMEELNEIDLVKSKKKRKKMKELCDLQSSEIASATPMPAKYSGHNISATSGVLESGEVSKETCHKVLEIDLNEAPQSE